MIASIDPDILDILRRWGVQPLEMTPTHDWACFARRGEEDVVAKWGDPESRAREAAALRHFGGDAARLLESDDDAGVILVERLLPGDDIAPLARTDDDAATAVIAELIVRLHRDQAAPPAGIGLPDLAGIGSAFDLPADPRVPASLRERARAVLDDLLADAPRPVVLHGDLHHFNVLRARWEDPPEWRCIDPHGWAGDPAFEVAAMLANPRGLAEGDARGIDGSAMLRLAERRRAILAEITGFDPDRIRAWSFAGSVIAELWMLESFDLVHGAPLALAEATAPTV
ncbi:MAG: aminoglycoside phosphotransferase family protein [bacterium]